MSLSLTQTQAISQLAEVLYDFLPGKPHPYANQDVSFLGAARACGVESFWTGGSKRPAIVQLLSLTLERRGQQFCPLVLAIVRRGMTYRQNRGQPLTREAIESLNQGILQLDIKIPDLWDPRFLSGLPSAEPQKVATTRPALSDEVIDGLNKELVGMTTRLPQERGYRFQRFLGELFEAHRLAPRSAFRLVGEEIDGSLQLGGETYLVEATWRGERVGQEELLAFSGKVSGKAQWSRGLMISYSGFTEGGLEAFARGRSTNIMCMDGLDLHLVLQERLDLASILEAKARKAAETNQSHVPVRDLLPVVQASSSARTTS